MRFPPRCVTIGGESRHREAKKLQFSLRELLVVALSFGLGLAALRAGGMLASAIMCVAVTLLVGVAIVAFVGRDQLQCFSIGFLIPVIVYAAAHLSVGDSELDTDRGRLPTTRLLKPMYNSVVERAWVDAKTGREIPDYDPGLMPKRHQGGRLPFGVTRVVRVESLDRSTFASLGHMLLAMILGYCGGKFAIVVKRYQDEGGASQNGRVD